MRTTVLHALLVVAVVTAGCSSISELSSQRDEKTLAPGLTESGIENADALASAHADVIGHTSHTVRRNRTERYANGTVRIGTNTTVAVGANESRFHYRQLYWRPSGGLRGYTELWSNGTYVYRMTRRGNHTAHSLVTNPNREPEEPRTVMWDTTYRDRLYVLFTAMNVTRVEQVDDGSRYRVVAAGAVYPENVARFGFGGSVENATLTATVDSVGVVHGYSLEYTGVVDGARVRGVERVRYSGIGDTTVDRPSWYYKAVENDSSGPDSRRLAGAVTGDGGPQTVSG